LLYFQPARLKRAEQQNFARSMKFVWASIFSEPYSESIGRKPSSFPAQNSIFSLFKISINSNLWPVFVPRLFVRGPLRPAFFFLVSSYCVAETKQQMVSITL
jgi:hypothetical protein